MIISGHWIKWESVNWRVKNWCKNPFPAFAPSHHTEDHQHHGDKAARVLHQRPVNPTRLCRVPGPRYGYPQH